MRNRQELEAFLIDPEHKLLLLGIEAEMRGLNFLAGAFLQQGKLSRGEIRHILDAELPHANWAGVLTTYDVYRPEIRGLLLSLMMLKAQGSEIPILFRQFETWLREDGYDERGESAQYSSQGAKDANSSNPLSASETDAQKSTLRPRNYKPERLWQMALEVIAAFPEENLDAEAAVFDLQNGDDLIWQLSNLPSDWAMVQLESLLPENLMVQFKEGRLESQDENKFARAMLDVLSSAYDEC
jgi:hypothetical protein